MRTQRRLALTGAAVTATTMLLAGCNGFGNGSSSTGGDSSGQSDAGSNQTAEQSTQAPTTPKIKWTLMTMSTKKLGRIMVNGAGLSVYRFDKDTAIPSKSNCLGACAKKWPPVTIHTTNLVLKGFDATLLGRIKRADGTWQLTLHGWPLYTYAGDTKAGVWKGQGLQGKWFVAAANGTKALAKKSSAAAGSGSASSGGTGSGGSGGSGGGSTGSGGTGGGDTGGGYGSGGGGY